jgi:hypothetical protein
MFKDFMSCVSEAVFTLVVGALFFLRIAGCFCGYCYQHIDIVNATQKCCIGSKPVFVA